MTALDAWHRENDKPRGRPAKCTVSPQFGEVLVQEFIARGYRFKDVAPGTTALLGVIRGVTIWEVPGQTEDMVFSALP